MNIPAPDYAQYATLQSLNVYDAPRLGSKIIGLLPGGLRIYVVAWRMDKDETMYACIGGFPEQWVTAYRNNERYLNYIGGNDYDNILPPVP